MKTPLTLCILNAHLLFISLCHAQPLTLQPTTFKPTINPPRLTPVDDVPDHHHPQPFVKTTTAPTNLVTVSPTQAPVKAHNDQPSTFKPANPPRLTPMDNNDPDHRQRPQPFVKSTSAPTNLVTVSPTRAPVKAHNPPRPSRPTKARGPTPPPTLVTDATKMPTKKPTKMPTPTQTETPATNLQVFTCPTSQKASGSQGFTAFVIELFKTSGTITVFYDMYTIPDELDIFYEHVKIFTTGGLVSGSMTVTVPFGSATSTSTKVTLEVYAPLASTAWELSVVCPP